jgi:beta-N-acetylhexosaminidase
MSARAVILGLSGTALTPDERAFFRDADPWGFIIFKRNVATRAQLSALTAELREAVGRDAAVFVDQEGGRVQRLGPPVWPARPPAAAFAELYAYDPGLAEAALTLNFRLIAHDLREVGVDADCAPVLDTPQPGADPIIGDRAYGTSADAIIRLGRAVLDGLAEGGVAGVIKHAPGHGRADVDSHLALPRVSAPAALLESVDLAPFKALADAPMAMTAHVIYDAWDGKRPATTSPRVIVDVIRGAIGFKGLLMTDDLSMKALGGSFEERSRAAIEAGCDVLLHCNGERAEMEAVAANAPKLAGAGLARAMRAEKARGAPKPFDPEEAQARLDAMLASVWTPPAYEAGA